MKSIVTFTEIFYEYVRYECDTKHFEISLSLKRDPTIMIDIDKFQIKFGNVYSIISKINNVFKTVSNPLYLINVNVVIFYYIHTLAEWIFHIFYTYFHIYFNQALSTA